MLILASPQDKPRNPVSHLRIGAAIYTLIIYGINLVGAALPPGWDVLFKAINIDLKFIDHDRPRRPLAQVMPSGITMSLYSLIVALLGILQPAV